MAYNQNGKRRKQARALETTRPDGSCTRLTSEPYPCDQPALPMRWCCAEHAEELEIRRQIVASKMR